MWVFFFLLGASSVCFAQSDQVSQIARTLVFHPDMDPYGPPLSDKNIQKIELHHKKADWTRKPFPELDSIDQAAISIQTELMLQKLNTILAKERFIDSLTRSGYSETFNEELGSRRSISVVFAQAQVSDPNIAEKEVVSQLKQLDPTPSNLKKEEGTVLLNIERIKDFGKWHPHFNQINAAGLNSIIGPFEEGGLRIFYKLIDRIENELPDSLKAKMLGQRMESLWGQHVSELLARSDLSQIRPHQSYLDYQVNRTVLTPIDTLATLGSVTFTLGDLALYQNVYERFVLTTDASIFDNSLRSYVVIPDLLSERSEMDAPFRKELGSALMDELETRIRANKVFREIVDSLSISEREIEDHYKKAVGRFTRFGTCSYLVAYIHDQNKVSAAEQTLKAVFRSGEFDPEMKSKEDGFTVKFEPDYNLNQLGREALAFRKIDVGTLDRIMSENEVGHCVLLTEKSKPAVIPLAEVRGQVISEIRVEKIAEIEKLIYE